MSKGGDQGLKLTTVLMEHFLKYFYEIHRTFFQFLKFWVRIIENHRQGLGFQMSKDGCHGN